MNTAGWVLLGLAIVVILVLFKFKEVRHKFGLLVVTVLVLFLAFSIYSVYSANKVDLNSFDGVVAAGKIYVVWLGDVFHNIADISGYAVKQDWGFTNHSNATSR